jgi:hypothetical protein
MLGSEILDVAIGLIFVYILVSIICSAVREALEAWMKKRAVYLERGIRELLNDPQGSGLAADVFHHPLIFGLFPAQTYEAKKSSWNRGAGLPSYIPSKSFALALLDIVARGTIQKPLVAGETQPITIEGIRQNVDKLPNGQIKRVVLTALDAAQGNLDKLQANLEAWYDSAMDRVSGLYKRSTHWILFAIGLFVAASMNVDTLEITHHLYRDESARAAVVAAAGKISPDVTEKVAKATISSLDLPIGWPEGKNPWVPPSWSPSAIRDALWEHFLGWLLTAFAATLGAPFWFDVLNKVMVIRSTVKPHEKSPEEGSEDRQDRAIAITAGQPAADVGVSAAATPSTTTIGNAADPDVGVDGCDLNFATVTPTSDEQLPAAEGGVA